MATDEDFYMASTDLFKPFKPSSFNHFFIFDNSILPFETSIVSLENSWKSFFDCLTRIIPNSHNSSMAICSEEKK